MTHKEKRYRRKADVLRVHELELKWKRYKKSYWYYFSLSWAQWNKTIPEEDQLILMFFDNNKTQKERAVLWRNQEFVNIFCNRYLTLF